MDQRLCYLNACFFYLLTEELVFQNKQQPFFLLFNSQEYKFFHWYVDELFAPPNYSQDTVTLSFIILYGSHDLKLWNNEVIWHFVYFKQNRKYTEYHKNTKTNRKIQNTTRKQTKQKQNTINININQYPFEWAQSARIYKFLFFFAGSDHSNL